MQPLPSDIVNLTLSYRNYVERNSNILASLVQLFIYLYYNQKRLEKIIKNLNKIMREYEAKSYFKITLEQSDTYLGGDVFGLELVIYKDDNLTDALIKQLILYFLLAEKSKSATPVFYPAGDMIKFVQKVNSILKHNNSRLRVILYDDEVSVESSF